MRYITPSQAQEIIDIACSTWKSTLADKWAVKMVTGQVIAIYPDFYQKMRKACTTDQHTLFDKIFGKDIKEGEWVTITGSSKTFKDGTITKKVLRVLDSGWVHLEGEFMDNGKVFNAWNYKFLRIATEQEVAKVTQIIPVVGKKYKLCYTGQFCHWYGDSGRIPTENITMNTFEYIGQSHITADSDTRAIFRTTNGSSYIMFTDYNYNFIVKEVK